VAEEVADAGCERFVAVFTTDGPRRQEPLIDRPSTHATVRVNGFRFE
jgi:hypothetical protein